MAADRPELRAPPVRVAAHAYWVSGLPWLTGDAEPSKVTVVPADPLHAEPRVVGPEMAALGGIGELDTCPSTNQEGLHGVWGAKDLVAL